MLADPICCWDHSGLPVLLIERRRDGGAVIIRSCVITQLSREDVSLLRYAKPAQVEAPPKESKRRRNDDGLSYLRRALRQSPHCLHAMAAQLGMPSTVADEVMAELFQSIGEAPPQPVLRRARGSKPARQQQTQAPVVVAQPPQRSAPDRSEAVRDEALRSRLAAIRLHDMGQHRCHWVRDGYQWFIRQQLAAQPGTRCSCSSNTASNWSTSASRRSMMPARE